MPIFSDLKDSPPREGEVKPTLAAPRPLRRWLAAAAVLMGASLPAQAAITQLIFVNSYDGTSGWDVAAGPGFDTDAHNGIVRTNDQFEYLATFSTSGGDNNLTLVSTLPQGNVAPRVGLPVARWTNVPADCTGAGSTISVDGQTLTCNLGNVASSGTRSVYLNATVLSTTPNGTALPAPSLTASSSATPSFTPGQTPAALAVTAAPFYDVVVQMSINGSPRAYGFMPANGPADEDGFFHKALVGLVAKNPNGHGNKGVEQLDPAQPVHYQMDVSGYPAGVRLDNWHPAAGGTFGSGCGSPNNGAPDVESGSNFNMHSRVGDAGGSNSASPTTVPNGGVCASATQASTLIDFDVNGINTTLQRRPTTAGTSGIPVPPSEWWVSNKGLVLWTPLTSYPPNVVVNHEIKLGSVAGRSISGQPITGDDLTNNSASYPLQALDAGSVLKKFRADSSLAPPLQTQCDPAVVFDCRTNYMTQTQTVRADVSYYNQGTAEHTGVYLCEIIDRTAFDIGGNFSVTTTWSDVSPTPPTPPIQYGTKAGGPYFASTDTATDPYNDGAAGASAYATARCNDPGITWHTSEAAAQAAGGLVYVRANVGTMPGSSRIGMQVRGLILRNTWAATISVLSPAAATRTAGQAIPEGTILRNEGDIGTSFTFLDGANIRDHLRVTRIRTTSRVGKSIVNPADGEIAPQPVGSTLTYRLQPRYSTTFPPLAATSTVTDVLPPNLNYVSGSATVGGNPMEPVVSTPAPGYTQLTWTLPGQTPFLGADGPAANLAPIEFRARVALTAPDSTVLTNSVAVSGGPNDYEADCDYVPASHNFGTCTKAASANVAVQTPPGFQVQKSTLTPVIDAGGRFRYNVDYVSFGTAVVAPDVPHFIDILPFVGDGAANAGNSFTARTPASAFNAGAYRLNAVTVPANDPTMAVYYTSAAPGSINNDPRHASNAIPGGSTPWCLAAQIGITPGCPATIAHSTAFRVVPGVAALAANTIYTLGITLDTDVNVAKAADLFNNGIGGRSPDARSQLLYVHSASSTAVRVGGASLSGTVFYDVDDNGSQGGGETGIGGVSIALQGCVAGLDGVLDTAALPIDGNAVPACAGDDQYVIRTTLTGLDGTYAFSGLPAGRYRVTEAQPAGYADGARAVGTSGGTANARGTLPSVVTDIVLATDVVATGYDFGEIRQAVVTVAKRAEAASGASVAIGQTLTYTVEVTVAEAPTRGVVTLTDTLGQGLELVPGSFTTPAGGACNAAGQVVTCTLAAGAAVGTHAFTYQAKVTQAATTRVNNQVEPSGTDEPRCTSPDACRTTHVVPGGSGSVTPVPVNAPWALAALSLLLGGLAYRRRR